MAGNDADPEAGDGFTDRSDHAIVARHQHTARLIVNQCNQPARVSLDTIGVEAGDLVLHLNEIILRRFGDLVAIILPAVTTRRPLDLCRLVSLGDVIQRRAHAGDIFSRVIVSHLAEIHVPAMRCPVGDTAFEERTSLHSSVGRQVCHFQLASLLHPQLPLGLVWRDAEEGSYVRATDICGTQFVPMRFVAHRDNSHVI